jgi:RES domain-containing protein
MALPVVAVRRRYWRVLTPRWASLPLSGAGAAERGGRWNAPGSPALYLSEEHITAFAEYMQGLERPGLLTPYDVETQRIVDLCDPKVRNRLAVDDSVLVCPWKTIARIERRRPPTWDLAARLADADGIRVPSAQHCGGVNLVLWRWNLTGGSTRVAAIDPLGDLPRDSTSWRS